MNYTDKAAHTALTKMLPKFTNSNISPEELAETSYRHAALLVRPPTKQPETKNGLWTDAHVPGIYIYIIIIML